MKKVFPTVFSVLIIVALAFLSSCKKDEVKPDVAQVNENDYVNTWILDKMKAAYYWTDRIPTAPDKSTSPEEFFNSLLAKPDDRFSWIQNNFQDLIKSLQGVSKEAGYEFALYRASEQNDNILARILYVKKASPAEAAGLNRGDVIDQINNQQLTRANYQTVLQGIGEPHSITYRPYDAATNNVSASRTISLTTVEYAENPNFLDKVITVNDRKIGYYVYNLFSTGPQPTSTVYNDEMDAVFARFKAAGITDLVLDLRFNSGGAETATVNLASLVGAGIDETKIFAKREFNAALTNEFRNDPNYGENFLTTKFKNKTQNVGSMLRNNRVYVLTGTRSASATELLINGLKPYMDVYLIGAKTVGKNVGSFSIYEENDPKNKWGMQPIVVKSLNSWDQSDYSTGFVPNHENADNGSQLPLGDSREILLNLALQHISGSGRVAVDDTNFGTPIGHSFDFKNRNSELVIDDKRLPK